MTPKQVALVQNSFAKVALTSEAAAMLFYDRLFDIAPQMKAMFPRLRAPVDFFIRKQCGLLSDNLLKFEQ